MVLLPACPVPIGPQTDKSILIKLFISLMNSTAQEFGIEFLQQGQRSAGRVVLQETRLETGPASPGRR